MAFKFRKRIRVFPGFTVNLSKSGLSSTIGIRGFSFNTGSKGTFLNVGLPGTGFYDRIRLDNPSEMENSPRISEESSFEPVYDPDRIEICTHHATNLTSNGLFGLKDSIVEAGKSYLQTKRELDASYMRHSIYCLLFAVSVFDISGYFLRKSKKLLWSYQEYRNILKENLSCGRVEIDFNLDPPALSDYDLLRTNFARLKKCCKIWDITSKKTIKNATASRTIGDMSIERKEVSFKESSLNVIDTAYPSLCLENANGRDLHIYPGFIALESRFDFSLIDLREIDISMISYSVHETQGYPSDATRTGITWKYTNKDGTPDRRYRNNSQIPVVTYPGLHFRTSRGLNELYLFSNTQLGEAFCHALLSYQNTLKKMNWRLQN